MPWTLQSKRSDHLFSPRGRIIRLGPDPEVAWAESFSEVIVEGAQDPISEGREETKIDVASTRLLAVVQTVKLSARVPSAEGTRIHAGLEAFIVSADALTFEGGQLRTAGTVIDLVYNRLTDFYIEAASHDALREAYETGSVVVTPDPHAHALYADKRNLITLSDREELVELGADDSTIAILEARVPRTIQLTSSNRDALWKDRKKYFFKTVSGYGGKAAYRGDKLTTSTWAEMTGREYVAQEIVRPSERTISLEGERVPLKLDVRAYVYNGSVQLMAARLYQGQTTNFRTPGGGFAPVFTECT